MARIDYSIYTAGPYPALANVKWRTYPAGGASTGSGKRPVISNIDPAGGTLLHPTTPITLDITDEDSSFRRIILMIQFAGVPAPEVIYDGGGFSIAYATESTITPITDGIHFSLIRAGGWPAAPTFTPFAIDVTGLENA